MSKPTLFFSHSSKDKDMILNIKNKIMEYTGSTLEIFMSSDGQSIPFGTNWIHKIEDGLNSAKIMFVFVTTNSVSSGWIYFEAGFAYSKGIQVIPVGIGVDVGTLKAPLNLLQGFNITSADGLNNFISIINKTFEYSFEEKFSETDYTTFTHLTTTNECDTVDFENIISSIDYDISAEYSDGNGGKVQYDIDSYFNKIVDYLENNSLSYSLENSYRGKGEKCLTVKGIKILYRATQPQTTPNGRSDNVGKLRVSLSPYNFEESFDLYEEFNKLFGEKESFYIRLRLKEPYEYVTAIEDSTSLLSPISDVFKPDKSRVGNFKSDIMNLSFRIFDFNYYDYQKAADYVMGISYDPNSKNAKSIIALVGMLSQLHVIRNKQEEKKNG